MMTTRQARRLQDDHGQAARDLQSTRKGELQAAWRDEMHRQGVILTGPAPATKDGLIQDLLSWRFPVAALNEASHVLYHAPSSRWEACEHCQARPTTTLVRTDELQPGDVVLEHGMRIRVDEVREYRPDGASSEQRAWNCPGTVLNVDDVVRQHVIPASFLETYGYREGEGWVVERRDAWTVQGNTLAVWLVELPRPAAPVHLASCGHPANEDGECGCSYWPERAPGDDLGFRA